MSDFRYFWSWNFKTGYTYRKWLEKINQAEKGRHLGWVRSSQTPLWEFVSIALFTPQKWFTMTIRISAWGDRCHLEDPNSSPSKQAKVCKITRIKVNRIAMQVKKKMIIIAKRNLCFIYYNSQKFKKKKNVEITWPSVLSLQSEKWPCASLTTSILSYGIHSRIQILRVTFRIDQTTTAVSASKSSLVKILRDHIVNDKFT